MPILLPDTAPSDATSATNCPDKLMVFSDAYPPVNRQLNGLHVLEIQLIDSLGTLVVDPNRAAVIGMTRKLPLYGFVAESVLSGEPAFRYLTCDGLDLALTEDELFRLLRHDLRPEEVLKLRNNFGIFHEIHDDFYREDTGESLQPMEA